MAKNSGQVLILISVGLVLATLIAYEPIRHNGFVDYDDGAYITENPNVTGEITLQSVIREFTGSHMGNWHPLTMLSHKLDYQLFGLNPVGHHLVNVLLHIANVLLVFWILNSMTGAMWASAFVAAVFAVHPLQVESVAWASERKTVLSGFFWFLTIAVYVWYVKKPAIGRYILLFVIYALSIMTKPVVVTLPLVLLLLDYWPLERIRGQKTEDGERQKTLLKQLIAEKIPLFVLSVILSVITFIVQRNAGAFMSVTRSPLDCRVANMFLSYIKYIGKMLWPNPLVAFYPYPNVNLSSASVMLCAVLFVLLSVIFIYAGRRRKYAVTGWLWYVGALVPMIGLVQAGGQAIADRYMYIPMLGLLIIVAWGVKEFVGGRPGWKAGVSVFAAAILLSAVAVTRAQVGYWQNSKMLFEHALKFTKDNHVAEQGYGSTLFAEGRFDEAESHLKNSLRICPGYLDAMLGLSKVYIKQDKPKEALRYLNDVLRGKGDSAEVYYCIGLAFRLEKKDDEAVKWFAKALKMDPKHLYARNEMGAALLTAGKPDEAIKYLNEALQRSINKGDIYINLGQAYNLLGRYDIAIQNWTRALELKPDDAELLNNLAWLLATTGDVSAKDVNKAIDYAERACELTEHKKPAFLDTLGAAYAAAGRFGDAVKTANRALGIAKADGQEDLANEIKSRIKLYEDKRPYHQK